MDNFKIRINVTKPYDGDEAITVAMSRQFIDTLKSCGLNVEMADFSSSRGRVDLLEPEPVQESAETGALQI